MKFSSIFLLASAMIVQGLKYEAEYELGIDFQPDPENFYVQVFIDPYENPCDLGYGNNCTVNDVRIIKRYTTDDDKVQLAYAEADEKEKLPFAPELIIIAKGQTHTTYPKFQGLSRGRSVSYTFKGEI